MTIWTCCFYSLERRSFFGFLFLFFLFVEYSKTQFPGLFFPKIKFLKNEKLPIYDKNHELCKNLSFPTFWTCCFYCPEKRLFVCQKRSFFDILERKDWPLNQKIEVNKKNNWQFSKGVSKEILSQMELFHICVFQKNYVDILDLEKDNF